MLQLFSVEIEPPRDLRPGPVLRRVAGLRVVRALPVAAFDEAVRGHALYDCLEVDVRRGGRSHGHLLPRRLTRFSYLSRRRRALAQGQVHGAVRHRVGSLYEGLADGAVDGAVAGRSIGARRRAYP